MLSHGSSLLAGRLHLFERTTVLSRRKYNRNMLSTRTAIIGYTIGYVLAFLAVLLKLYTRIKHLAGLKADDYLVLIALVSHSFPKSFLKRHFASLLLRLYQIMLISFRTSRQYLPGKWLPYILCWRTVFRHHISNGYFMMPTK